MKFGREQLVSGVRLREVSALQRLTRPQSSLSERRGSRARGIDEKRETRDRRKRGVMLLWGRVSYEGVRFVKVDCITTGKYC